MMPRSIVFPFTMPPTPELESQQMEEEEEKKEVVVSGGDSVVTDVSLRLLVAATSLAAAVVIATNHQQRWGVRVDFTLFQVWIAFVATNLGCAAYAAATAALMRRLRGRAWLHHADQLAVNLVAAAIAGAGAVGSIAMWGNETSGWYAVCRLYRSYCNVGLAALLLSSAALLLLSFACARSRYPSST
ncbi:CASP-like protein UU1 [Oryza brachyantha]|uniref:CASP-like protein UU1 n=1 Tax=Oryza brachyantha TaxID=4533 RepID=UPI001ADA7878|nr:CASP-like protein UU1 [Oryza brachyantha]XP_040382580.1 CASP-like protein UU1 [Oryza brachyantha]